MSKNAFPNGCTKVKKLFIKQPFYINIYANISLWANSCFDVPGRASNKICYFFCKEIMSFIWVVSGKSW